VVVCASREKWLSLLSSNPDARDGSPAELTLSLFYVVGQYLKMDAMNQSLFAVGAECRVVFVPGHIANGDIF